MAIVTPVRRCSNSCFSIAYGYEIFYHIPLALGIATGCPCLIFVVASLPHMSICTRVVVSITFHQVDYAPDTKAGTDCNDQCLKNIDCTAKKSHNQMCEQTLFLMVCKRLALLLSLLFRPFFTCFICKAILSLSSLFSPFFLLLDFFLEKT